MGRALEGVPEGGFLHHAVGGAALAAEAAELGLIDEYRAKVYPVLAGGGVPFFPQSERRVDLELVETRRLGATVGCLRHWVVRSVLFGRSFALWSPGSPRDGGHRSLL